MTFEFQTDGDREDEVNTRVVTRTPDTKANRDSIRDKIEDALDNCDSCDGYDYTVSSGQKTPTGHDTIEAEINTDVSDDGFAGEIEEAIKDMLKGWMLNNP